MSVCALLSLAGCSKSEADRLDEYRTRTVILPDGTQIRAEAMTQQHEMARGMMYRDSLPEGRGMLFIHGSPGKYPYWMFQVKVPLDIVWLDGARRIVEIVADAPPCTTQASQCPNYGGKQNAVVVLELPGGSAKRHGLQVGQTINY